MVTRGNYSPMSSLAANLDEPAYWTAFATLIYVCPFWTETTLAQHDGVDVDRAVAMVRTYCHPIGGTLQ